MSNLIFLNLWETMGDKEPLRKYRSPITYIAYSIQKLSANEFSILIAGRNLVLNAKLVADFFDFEMPVIEKIGRRNSVPIIYVRGTHYEVGFDVGRTFKSLIHSYIDLHGPLNKIYIPLYRTSEGKKCYDQTLAAVKKNFPQYVEEIQGTAEGSGVPFHVLFLLHMDEILPCSIQKKFPGNCNGCSTVCCNIPGQEILGHNEDALAETLNHFYFVSAHIITELPKGRWQVKEEKFTSLCYAGTLPGFTMTRTILTRALLTAENVSQAEEILKDPGTGIGDAVSINMIFLKQEGSKLFYNAEAAPTEFPATDSLVNIITASPGEHIYHCNRFLTLKAPECSGFLIESSDHRRKAMDSLPVPKCCEDVYQILGDESDKEFPLFGNEGMVKTIATGIFNLNTMTWSIFTDNPKTNDPVMELPILI